MNHRVHDHRKTAEYHEAEYNTRLAASVLGINVKTELVKPYIDGTTESLIKELLIEKGMYEGHQFVVLHPGSGGSAYNWNAIRFGQLADAISKKYALKIIISGVESESSLCKIVQEKCPGAINLCGVLNLKQMIALLSQSRLMVSNSTGVLHIAAALDIPVIGIYPNSPHISAKRWGPYNSKSFVVTPPHSNDSKYCDDMNLISVDEVFKAVGTLLK